LPQAGPAAGILYTERPVESIYPDTSMTTNTIRIAKNTLMLYFRQILIMLVSLYTVRATLEILGAEDYGIYNVAAGVVTMFGFLSGSLAAASQRYFAFEIGTGDSEQLRRMFSLNLLIYALIALIVVLLAETAGLWFVNHKLIIPPERMKAALWIYQFSIISFVFTIMVTPFMAVIIAHEDMNIYAAVSIAEAALKLVIVFLLKVISLDKLQLYGILICAVTAVNAGIYRTICKSKYQECTFRFYWSKELFKEIAGFTGWNLFGSASGISKNQGVNILLNQFFNPVIVATRSITVSLNNVISILFSNFSIAVTPQIIKSYASNKKEDVIALVFSSSKYIYYMMYILALPSMFEMPKILSLWLMTLPENLVLFARLAFFDTLICSIGIPLGIAVSATGKIKLYQSVLGIIHFLNFPVCFIVLRLGFPAYSVMIVAIILSLIAFVVRLLLTKRVFFYSIKKYFFSVLLPICKVSVLSIILPLIIYISMKQSLLRLFLLSGTSVVSICGCIYFLGLNFVERRKITAFVRAKLR
jgi:O-antigen/teichoic acid export membrane protein